MAMNKAGRRGDLCSGHADAKARPALKGSPDILVNDRAALRVGDTYAKHGPSAHAGAVKTGSPTVWFNDVQAARVDDPIDCGSKVAEGSPDVEIGDAKPGDPSAKLNAVLAQRGHDGEQLLP
jgi:uncharacterized Zn-binding protein involved in type VI secretion